jgi:hypothetical protein
VSYGRAIESNRKPGYLAESALRDGRILAGFKFEAVPAATTEGVKDLPGIRLYIPGVTEIYRGAFVAPGMTVNLLLATRRTTDPNAIVEHLKALEKLMDALDKNAQGEVDPGLGGSLRTPMTLRTGSQYVLDLSVNSELTLTLEPRAAARGSRQ